MTKSYIKLYRYKSLYDKVIYKLYLFFNRCFTHFFEIIILVSLRIIFRSSGLKLVLTDKFDVQNPDRANK